MKSPIRVLNIIARLNVGGPAIHVALITEHLGSPDYDSRLVAGSVGAEEGDMSYYAAQHGVTPIMIAELGRELHPIRDLKTLWKVYRLIREFKPTSSTPTPRKRVLSGGWRHGWQVSP